jgi:hypothetical protein
MPTAQSIQTFTGAQIKAIGEYADKQGYGPAPAAPKKDEQKQDPPADQSPHATDQKPSEAILSKDPGGYAQRGHDFLLASASGVADRKKSPSAVYGTFDRAYLTEEMRALLRKHAAFPGPGGSAANFNPGARAKGAQARQRYPYGWEAHHMLPASAFFHTDDAGKPAFTADQMDLLKQTPYDLNHGHNMIMLPKIPWAVPVHELLQHPSDHPVYTKRVIVWMQDLAISIEELQKTEKDHQKVVANFFERLKRLENDAWNHIVKISRSSVEAVVAGKAFHHENVLYKALTRKTEYDFGRLF